MNLVSNYLEKNILSNTKIQRYPNDSATKLRNECPGFILLSSFFQSEGNYAFVNTMGRRQMKNSRCFKPACGGKVAHFENDTASEK